MGRVIIVEPNVTDEDKEKNMFELKEVLKEIAASLNEDQLEHLKILNKDTNQNIIKEIIRC